MNNNANNKTVSFCFTLFCFCFHFYDDTMPFDTLIFELCVRHINNETNSMKTLTVWHSNLIKQNPPKNGRKKFIWSKTKCFILCFILFFCLFMVEFRVNDLNVCTQWPWYYFNKNVGPSKLYSMFDWIYSVQIDIEYINNIQPYADMLCKLLPLPCKNFVAFSTFTIVD